MIRFCAIADTLDARDTRWPEQTWRGGLGWAVLSDLPKFPRSVLVEAVAAAFARISEVCAPKFRETEPSAAHFLIRTEPLDGPGGVLADCFLPPANPIRMRLDTGERWNQSVNLLPVIKHELGHGMGMQHDPQRGALLSAYYDPDIQDYTPRDVARLQTLYGPPTIGPSPTPTPGPAGSKVTIVIHNAELIEIPGYRVVPVK